MPIPVLIDTDMGVDDAVAVALAMACPELEVVGLVSVGGNVNLDRATNNVGRLLRVLSPAKLPLVGRGLDQDDPSLLDAGHVHGSDGLGELDLPEPVGFSTQPYADVYEQLIKEHGSELAVVAIGPLTNLAGLLHERPGLLAGMGRVVIMGGAVWCAGNITTDAEFNFYRDPQAAAAVLAAGLPTTLVSLDVTTQVVMDELHVSHLASSRSASAQVLARMIEFPLRKSSDGGGGRFQVHDAVAVAALVWPGLFLRSKMGLQVTLSGPKAGMTRPVMSRDKSRQTTLVISVQVTDFLENLLERLCGEKFVV